MTTNPPRLYVFPHAGGSAQYYVPFSKAFSKDIKRIAVQYPGKGGTHDLASFKGISDLADQVCRMVSPSDPTEGKVAFFGHSMGGLVAFEVARRFEAAANPISALFVSACAAPGHSGYDSISSSDEGLLGAVSEMTGVNPEFLENPEFAATILPTLRGLRAIADYRCAEDIRLSCPIIGFLGDNDDVATFEKMRPWAERTESQFTSHVFSGHHFYLNDHLPELVARIEGEMTSYCEI